MGDRIPIEKGIVGDVDVLEGITEFELVYLMALITAEAFVQLFLDPFLEFFATPDIRHGTSNYLIR